MVFVMKSDLPANGMSYSAEPYRLPGSWTMNRYGLFGFNAPFQLIKSGAASPARRISSTDPANGDPGEANT